MALSKINRTISFDATSIINGAEIVGYNANVNSNGGFNINEDVRDYARYRANPDECEADYKEFRDTVRALVLADDYESAEDAANATNESGFVEEDDIPSEDNGYDGLDE